MNHIELFAGCGGLSLGLESAGFELLLANELSPMASETFAYNFFGTDLTKPETLGPVEKRTTKWLSSRFSVEQLEDRLKEDPRKYPELGEGTCDVAVTDVANLKGNLIVGSIVQLNKWLMSNPKVRNDIKTAFGRGGVDLVSGGPPCQSFSMAGMREYTNSRNVLPMEFADFVQQIQPRMALLENVSGILRPFTVDGEKVYAWYEVAKAFVVAGYVPLCLHVNAKLAGVAQSRPRFLMVLFRLDFCDDFLQLANSAERALIEPSRKFFDAALANPAIPYGALDYFDVADEAEGKLYTDSFLKPLMAYRARPFTVRDAIDDLNEVNPSVPSQYIKDLDAYLRPLVADHSRENDEMRKNSPLVQRRFKIYQNIGRLEDRMAQKEALSILRGQSEQLSIDSFVALSKFKYVDEDAKEFSFKKGDVAGMVQYFIQHMTKKRTQKALDPSLPAPAALSIPDDACHYDALRTLSVREMARIQSFPDNFAFRSKATTGGHMRKYQVPQYTQVGNAVPPLLGRAIGLALRDVLRRTTPNASSSTVLKKNKVNSAVAA